MEEKNIEKHIEQNSEKNIDIKGILANFLKDEEPEISQEEAIKKYSEYVKKRKYNLSDGDEDTEEEEHLKRVKQELLASLERVKKLEQKIYGKKEKEKTVQKIKVKSNNGGMQESQSRDNSVSNELSKGLEREKEK